MTAEDEEEHDSATCPWCVQAREKGLRSPWDDRSLTSQIATALDEARFQMITQGFAVFHIPGRPSFALYPDGTRKELDDGTFE